MKGRGHRDALVANILQWLLWLESGKVVGLYCSDVSGAFDRVDREILVRKIRSSGLSPCLVRILESWLDDRVAEVVVGGQAAAPAPLRNSVYQGTVWGPPLWNLHYESARHSVNKCGFREVAYADDKDMWKPSLHLHLPPPYTTICEDARGPCTNGVKATLCFLIPVKKSFTFCTNLELALMYLLSVCSECSSIQNSA
jgi:hypothetical protein